MVLYPATTSADSPLAHMVAHPLQLALVLLFHPPTGVNTALALGQLMHIYIWVGGKGLDSNLPAIVNVTIRAGSKGHDLNLPTIVTISTGSRDMIDTAGT